MLHVQNVAKELKFRWHMVSTYMFAFNGSHVKRTELVSNESFTHHLSRGHPGKQAAGIGEKTAVTTVRSDGLKQCSGTRALKDTQTYPLEFGREVATALTQFRQFYDDCGCTRGQLNVLEDPLDESGPWDDAELEGVLRVLRIEHSR